MGVGVPDDRAEKRKSVFLYTVLTGWVLVLAVSLYNHLAKGGPLPDPILLSVPTGVWLAINPPLPSTMREERQNDAK